MLKSLIRYSIRSFKRQRSYIIINILGLSIGIACSLLITLFVINEAGYDRYNVNRDRIFRVVLNGKIGGQEVIGAFTPSIMAPTMLREVPEVEDVLRMTGRGPTIVEYNGQTFTEEACLEADSSFFSFFTIPVIKGDPAAMLNAAHKVILTESTARKIFGNEDPIDKALKLGTDTVRYIVTGVIGDIPPKTHFTANMITSFMTNPRHEDPTWMNNSFSTYLLIRPNASYQDVERKIPDMLVRYVGPELERYMGISIDEFTAQGNRYTYFLQNLTDIHLDPSVQQEFGQASDPKYLWIFGSIAVLIVLIAAINFMNLSTAQAARRAKEVGIKKVSGSTRGMLISQFMTESFILAFASLLLSLLIIKLSLPYFNNLLGTTLRLGLFDNWYTVPVLLLFTLLVGILSGSYPALFLSSFNPYMVLKGSARNSMQNGRLRRVLVIFQFAVSILLIVGTMIMYRQIRFMLNKDVGFNKEQLIVINRAGAIGNRVNAFKEAVRNIPGVVNITSSTAVPGRNNNNNGYGLEGRDEESFLMQTNWVDYDYLDTYGMTLAEGRFFSESHTTDQEACLINENAARDFEITDISRARFIKPDEGGTPLHLQVIGVVKNFNHESLRNPIQPYIFCFKGDGHLWGYLTVRLTAQSYQSTIAGIESVWKEFTGNNPLQYYFLDEDFENMYIQEKQNAQMAVIFSILAIFIAALGLFGLTSFTIEQRTKEIGVRKAMGSSVAGIYVVISREIIVLVSISALIAWPVSYFVADRWLENFHYRIEAGVFTFIAGLAIALGIAILTISYRIMKAARVNPASSLKYE
ncbi:MAG: ABC transporter permease [Bacteroidales bacterium]|jgi:putative ABC transport system permease protein|nr:ABC transporter permease [Bacteroidales bacterium]